MTGTTPSPPAAPDVAGPVPDPQRSRLVEDLSRRQHGLVTRPEVEGLVDDSWAALRSTARISTYLPVLVRRLATDRVDALARTRGGGRRVPQVLFLCVQNAGRSQMAAALLEHHALGRIDARSAGSRPAGELNPHVVESLARVGVTLDEAYPKPVTDEIALAADVVVSMGCGDACPVAPGARFLTWDVPDPDGLGTDDITPIRDDIDRRVRALLEELR